MSDVHRKMVYVIYLMLCMIMAKMLNDPIQFLGAIIFSNILGFLMYEIVEILKGDNDDSNE